MMLDWSTGELAEGLNCFHHEQFFETHEHWELVWLNSVEPEKSFLQALIQVAAAFHHWQRGNRVGTVSLLGRALRRLDACSAGFGGIDVASLRIEVIAWLQAIQAESASVPQNFPQILPV